MTAQDSIPDTQSPLQRILCVDDDLALQGVIRLSLVNVGGFTVEFCTSGGAALELAPRFRPDLVLLDAMLPEMDGPSILAALRGFPEFARTPIVFLTGRADPSDLCRFKALGARDVIAKPFNPLTLPDRLREIWAAAQA